MLHIVIGRRRVYWQLQNSILIVEGLKKGWRKECPLCRGERERHTLIITLFGNGE